MKDVKIFSDVIEIKMLEELDVSELYGCKIRIMPNAGMHARNMTGFTSTFPKKIMPDILGSDIGCGIRVSCLGKADVDTKLLNEVIRKNIPFGRNVHEKKLVDFFKYDENNMPEKDRPFYRFERCIGTLGGGSHFIELDEDASGNKYLIVHSGSRGYGLKVSVSYKYSNDTEEFKKINYMKDMDICLKFAAENRYQITKLVLEKMGLNEEGSFDTYHNFIDKNHVLRKGAVSAYKNERVIIPLDKEHGCVIGTGKGNADWNCSAPAFMCREDNVEEFLERLRPTVEVNEVLRPIYSFNLYD